FLKLNCEGAEVPIVEDLVASGWFARIRSVLLDLDARKIPSLGARLNRLLDTLGATDIHNWVFPEDVQYGQQCTFGGIHHWLRVAGAHEVSVGSVWRSGAYHMGLWREGAFRGYYKFLVVRLLPSRMVTFYYRFVRPRIQRDST